MKPYRYLVFLVLALLPMAASGQSAPYYQSHFPPEEFKARWQSFSFPFPRASPAV